MTYKKAVKLTKKALKDTTVKRRYAKEYDRECAATMATLGRPPKLAKLPDPRATALRATLLTAALAHSRGKLHFQKVGLWWAYNSAAAKSGQNSYRAPMGEAGLDWQFDTILKHVKKLWKQYDRPDWYRFNPCLSEDELTLVETLLTFGEVRRKPITFSTEEASAVVRTTPFNGGVTQPWFKQPSDPNTEVVS